MSKERSEAQKRADQKYKREKVHHVYVDFYGTDSDIFEHLAKQPQKQTYIKKLIREDMQKGES